MSYLIAGDDLYGVCNDGRGQRLHPLIEGVSQIDPNSQHGKCLADLQAAGLVVGKCVVTVGNHNGVTAHTFNGASHIDTFHEVMTSGRLP